MPLVSALTPASNVHVGDVKFILAVVSTSGEQVVRPGWLAANGALVLQSKYAKLFAEVGFAYSPTPGADPGGGQFYLPNHLDGQNPIARGASSFTSRGARGGARTVALTQANEPDHTHSFFSNMGPRTDTDNPFAPRVEGAMGGFVSATTTIPDGHPGSASAHQNMPPVQVVGGACIRF